MYPKKEGLLCSLRWEQIRNGIQDHEYFRMLEDKIKKIKAELGTKIVVQGRELPVSEDGLFMENVRLSRNNTVVIEAEHRAGKKTIIRQFDVLY